MATRIKRYEAPLADLDALLARIEAEMGPAAELETREFKRRRFLGLFGGQRMVEVIAILEVDGGEAPVQPVPQTVSIPQPVPEPAATRAAARLEVLPAAEPEPPAEPTPEYGLPPVGKPHKVDLSADAPVQIADAVTLSPAERITASARRVAQAGSFEEPEPQAEPVEPAKPAPAPKPVEPAKPAPPPEPQSIPADFKPAAAPLRPKQEPEAPAAMPETVDAIQPAEQPAGRDAPVIADSGELSELRESIGELRDAIQMLVAAQQAPAAKSATAPVANSPEPAPDIVVAAPVAPAEPVLDPEDVVDMLAHASGDQLANAMDLVNLSRRVADPMSLDRGASLPMVQRQVYDRLLDWNVGSYDALELINNALEDAGAAEQPSEKSLLDLIFREICRNILLSGGIKLGNTPPGKAVALIGATGVGKTTTIAKLAAVHAFQLGKRVSLVSLDNYRIAAAEQLRTYAEIMGIDIDIVFGHDEFDQVLTQRRSGDLVLIDTAGRSPANSNQIYQLREVFSAHPPDEVHLVVSASTKADDLRMHLENFAPLSYDHVIVSKLDETRSLGCLYNLVKYCPLPISYFTVGQSVPEDIRTASLAFVRTWIEQGRIS